MKTFTICYKYDGRVIPFVNKQRSQLHCYDDFVVAAKQIESIVAHVNTALKGTPLATEWYQRTRVTPPSEPDRIRWEAMIDTIFIKEDEM